MGDTCLKQQNNTPPEILERKVADLLRKYAKDEYSRTEVVPHIAKTSLMMNHLYQDLGFSGRMEMGSFMKEHFPEFAAHKPADKLWKKYIYDTIGEMAPACVDCRDQASCFGRSAT